MSVRYVQLGDGHGNVLTQRSLFWELALPPPLGTDACSLFYVDSSSQTLVLADSVDWNTGGRLYAGPSGWTSGPSPIKIVLEDAGNGYVLINVNSQYLSTVSSTPNTTLSLGKTPQVWKLIPITPAFVMRSSQNGYVNCGTNGVLSVTTDPNAASLFEYLNGQFFVTSTYQFNNGAPSAYMLKGTATTVTAALTAFSTLSESMLPSTILENTVISLQDVALVRDEADGSVSGLPISATPVRMCFMQQQVSVKGVNLISYQWPVDKGEAWPFPPSPKTQTKTLTPVTILWIVGACIGGFLVLSVIIYAIYYFAVVHKKLASSKQSSS